MELQLHILCYALSFDEDFIFGDFDLNARLSARFSAHILPLFHSPMVSKVVAEAFCLNNVFTIVSGGTCPTPYPNTYINHYIRHLEIHVFHIAQDWRFLFHLSNGRLGFRNLQEAKILFQDSRGPNY